MGKTVKSYGEWVSPITSEVATASACQLSEVQVDCFNGKETVFWIEMRYDEGGRYVINSKELKSSQIKEWTPKDMNARTLVHEYGGGSYFVWKGEVYFSNFKDQRLYRQKTADSKPEPLTPADSDWRYADGSTSDKTGKIYIVREDHSKVKSGQSHEPTNSIVCIDPTNQKQSVLCCGYDFYSSPKVSSDGKQIAWMQWNHPNMPWDNTEIWRAELNQAGDTVLDGSAKKVAGGSNCVMCPAWLSNEELLFISDESDWWNLHKLSADGSIKNVCPQDKELGSPHWVFAKNRYTVNTNRPGEVLMVDSGNLATLSLKDGVLSPLPHTGFSSHSYLRLSNEGRVYCVAESPTRFTCVISVDMTDNNKVEIIKVSQTNDIKQDYYSVPEEIKYPTSDGDHSFAYYYPPTNPDFEAPDGELPPLLVKVHGGPTSQCSKALTLKIQYFTSRGFAVLDVNYRGSTGYGTKYRNALRGRWGICDIEDCCAGALYLCEQKKADRNKLCIDGGSAGGYTTLACLAFKDVFKAGCSLYGVADLELLAKETHKFESRYLDLIVGPYPEKKDIYHQRSALHNIDGFNCPIIFFQGDEDKIVLPNQAELMFEAIKKKGIPCSLVMFEGEQHGFRKSENIRLSLDGELYFYSRVFNFSPPGIDLADKIQISNM